jgi:LysM repeat protein
MMGIIGVLKDLYIRLLVWLGAAPPAGYEHLLGQPPVPGQYTVQAGDTLFSIARKVGVHYDLVAKANHLHPPDGLVPGQVLTIPPADWLPEEPAKPAKTLPVKAEPAPADLVAEPQGDAFDEDEAALAELDSMFEEAPAPPQPAPTTELFDFETEPEPAPAVEYAPETAPSSEPVFRYTVQRGDTMSAVARKYGLTIKDLVEANDIINPNLIFPGQKLVIPGYLAPEQPSPETLPTPQAPFIRPAIAVDPDFAPYGPAEAVRALYVSYFGIGHPETRDRIFNLLDTTEFNAVVIDAKGDHGLISYPTQTPLAHEIGAARPTARDFVEVMALLKARQIYTIARIVTLKDNPYARSKPEHAVKTRRADGPTELWHDSDQLAWADPFLRPVWDYNIQLAIEAAQQGFDEIQFDYVRFPTPSQAGVPHFSQEVSRDSRVAAITSFLSAARGQLKPLGVKVAANVFGYTCWRKDDTLIGQDIDRLGQYVDVLSPMLYPSTFGSGIPGYKLAIAHPYEVVFESTRQAVNRVTAAGCVVRPWIQDFPDYRFDQRTYHRAEIQAQIKGCFDAAAGGFMVWNPLTKYTEGAYAPVKTE